MEIGKGTDSVQLGEQVKPLDAEKQKGKGPEKATAADKAAKGDTLSISGQAREKAKIAQYVKIVKEMPGIRDDKVAEAKRKLASGEYGRPEVADKIAERILEG